MASARPKLTDDERAARRQADRDRLEQAARALLCSDGWQRWVRVRGQNGLSRYSLHNQLLIALQAPDASFVAGFRAWLKLDRCVRKGERAIRILAPITLRDRDDTDTNPSREDDDEPRVLFRSVAVFDVAQADPLPGRDPAPLAPPREPITGDSHRALLAPLHALAGDLGYTVTTRPLDGVADGWCDAERREIVLNKRLTPNARVRVLVHELAHALGLGYQELGRRRAEVLVDCVTYIVCAGAGLEVGGESIPYVAGWGEDGELDAIRAYAATIDEVARRIEAALEPSADQAVAEAA